MKFFKDFALGSIGNFSAVKIGALTKSIAFEFLEAALVIGPFVGNQFSA